MIIVSKKLGPLKDSVVFIGGAVTSLLLTDAAAAAARPTEDVDLIVGITSRTEYYRLEENLRKLGFKQSMSAGDPICRWIIDSVIVDIMPIDESVLGFGNPWYETAFRTASSMNLDDQTTVKVISAPCFLATKIKAFGDRGKGDYLLSPDMEDILAIVDGRPELGDEIQASEPAVRTFLRSSVSNFLQNSTFMSCLPAHLRGDSTGQERLPELIERLEKIASI